MQDFTPVSGAIGGAMIGASAALLLLLYGRIAGISGIAGSLIRPRGEGRAWRAAFVLGLIAGPIVVAAVRGEMPRVELQAPIGGLLIAGFLVGVGTRLGSGCTSGHGVCGLARLSPRSLAATATFFAAAVTTVFVLRHVVGG